MNSYTNTDWQRQTQTHCMILIPKTSCSPQPHPLLPSFIISQTDGQSYFSQHWSLLTTITSLQNSGPAAKQPLHLWHLAILQSYWLTAPDHFHTKAAGLRICCAAASGVRLLSLRGSSRRRDQSVVVRQVAPAQLLQLLHLPFLTKPLHETTCLLSRRLLQTRPPQLNAGGNLALTLRWFLVEHH